jgi:hypothetical protein
LADTESARRNGETVLTACPGFDTEAKTLNRRPKLAVPWGDINPDDQHTGWGEEVHKPVQCSLKRLDRMLPPLNQTNVISATAKLARRGGGDTRITAVAQLKKPGLISSRLPI